MRGSTPHARVASRVSLGDWGVGCPSAHADGPPRPACSWWPASAPSWPSSTRPSSTSRSRRIRESFPDASIGDLSWVLNAYNIVFAAFLDRVRAADGPDRAASGRSPAGIALFTRRVRCCARAAPYLELLVAARVLQALGAALLVPASLAIVVEAFTDRAARARHRAVGSDRRRGRRPRPADRRRAGRARRLAVGLPGQPPVRRRSPSWPRAVRLVESRAPGRRVAARHPRRPAARRGPRAAEPGHRSRATTGAGRARASLGSFVRRRPARRAVRAQLAAAPRAGRSTPRCCGSRRSGSRAWPRSWPGSGFYAYLLTNILWLQYVWGYDVLRAGLALVPGALVAAVVAARLGPLAERTGTARFVVPGALVWAGAYLWYHQHGRGRAGVLGRVAAGAGAQRASASVRPCRCSAAPPWRPSRAVGTPRPRPRVQRPPARRRPGHRDPRRDRRGARPGRARSTPSATAGCSRSSPSCSWPLRRRADRPRGRPAPRTRTSTTASRCSCCPTRRTSPVEPVRTADDGGLDDVPLVAALSERARVALTAASRTVDAGGRGAGCSQQDDPPGSAYLRAQRPDRGRPGRRGGPEP